MRTEDITLGFYSGADEKIRDIATRYWAQGERRAFEEAVETLCREVDLSPEGLLNRIRQHSSAQLTVSKCVQCGDALQLYSRNDYLKRMRAEFPCDSCRYPPDVDDEGDDEIDTLPCHVEESDLLRRESLEGASVCGSGPDVLSDVVDEVLAVAAQLQVLPTRLHAALSVSLEDFTLNPAAVVQACNGEPLVVIRGNEPLFYCVLPTTMASLARKGR